MSDLYTEMQLNINMLDKAISESKARGSNSALCENRYRIALAKYMAERRAEGVPVTILSDISRGDPEIARLRMEKDIALSLYESSKEAINAYKLKIRVLNDQIAREWSKTEN